MVKQIKGFEVMIFIGFSSKLYFGKVSLMSSLSMFESFIIIQIIQKMGKKIPHQKKNIVRNSQNTPQIQIYQESEENSTGPNIFKTNQQNIPDLAPSPRGEPKIKKQRKKRQFNSESKFQDMQIKKFYIFPFVFGANHPFCKISWQYWKPNKYFVKMSEYFDEQGEGLGKKTANQCKSFDERQKGKVFTKIDLLQAAFEVLRKQPLDEASIRIIERYLQKIDVKSDYMSFLENGDDFEGTEGSSFCSQKQQQLQFGNDVFKAGKGRANQNPNAIFNEFLDLQSYYEQTYAKV